MGAIRSWFDSGEDYSPASYTTTIDAPVITETSTSTTLSKEESPKQAETADTSEYEANEKKRRKRNGVSGTFTNFNTDTIDTAVQSDAIGV